MSTGQGRMIYDQPLIFFILFLIIRIFIPRFVEIKIDDVKIK